MADPARVAVQSLLAAAAELGGAALDRLDGWLQALGLAAWVPTAEERGILDQAAGEAGGGAGPATGGILARLCLTGRPAPRVAAGRPPGRPADIAALERGLRRLPRLTCLAVLDLLRAHQGDASWGPCPGVPYAVGAAVRAGVAACRAATGGGYLLAAGDVSGIQRFIYRTGTKGALKSLRARSFFLELVLHSVQERLLGALGLPPVCGIYSGGGRFYALLPDTEAAGRALEEVTARTEDALYEAFGGDIAIHLAAVPLKTLGQATEAWQAVNWRLAERKSRRLAGVAARGGPSFWEARDADPLCPVCGRHTDRLVDLAGDGEAEACPRCRAFFEAGGRLTRARAVVEAPAAQAPESLLRLGDLGWSFWDDPAQALAAAPASARVWLVGEDPAEALADPRCRVLPYARLVARDRDGDALDMDGLAAAAGGAPLVGALRMDLDLAGTLFSAGLPAGERSLTHLAALSRAVSHFFQVDVPRLLRERPSQAVAAEHAGAVTAVYIGGDDLFLVGAWDAVLDAAFRVQEALGQASGENPSVTVSAGFVVADPRFPLYHLARLAGEAEELAKESGRDSIVLFYDGHGGRAFRWAEARRWAEKLVLPFLGELGFWDGQKRRLVPAVSRGLLHRIAEAGRRYRDRGRYDFGSLYYALARAREELERRGSREEARARRRRAWEAFSAAVAETAGLAAAPVFLTWVDLLSRGGDDYAATGTASGAAGRSG